jgi:tetratricopeptide (TPR) repeat protein
MFRRFALLPILFGVLSAQEVSEGFQRFYSLEYPQALVWFQAESARDPQDPEPYTHIAQTILYAEMFRNGMLESELVSGNNPFLRRPGLNPSDADQRLFFDSIRKAAALCETRLRRDPRDKAALYAIGSAYGVKGSWEFLIKRAYGDALSDTNKANRYHERITAIDPDFADALLVQGVHQYVLGSMPRGARWFNFLVGLHGDKAKGIEMLRKVELFGQRNRLDAEVLLAATYRRERRFAEAIPLLSVLSDRFPRNFILKFELAQIYSDLGDKRRALEILEEIERLRAANAPGYKQIPRERVQYARGNLLFWYREYDQALDLMTKATANAQVLDLNTGVLAWMRLGQLQDLKGQHDLAIPAYKQAIALAPKSDAAIESKRYIGSPYRRKS